MSAYVVTKACIDTIVSAMSRGDRTFSYYVNPRISLRAYNPKEGTTLAGAARLAAWPTVKAWDGRRESVSPAEMKRDSLDLKAIVHLAGYRTPMAGDLEGGTMRFMPGKAGKYKFSDQAVLMNGSIQNGLPAEMEKRGHLNPDLCRWLMGYPPVFCECAVMAMQSFPKSRRRSSDR